MRAAVPLPLKGGGAPYVGFANASIPFLFPPKKNEPPMGGSLILPEFVLKKPKVPDLA